MRWTLALLLMLVAGCFGSHGTDDGGGDEDEIFCPGGGGPEDICGTSGATGVDGDGPGVPRLEPPLTERNVIFERVGDSWVSNKGARCRELTEGFDDCFSDGWAHEFDGTAARVIVMLEWCWRGDEFSLSASQLSDTGTGPQVVFDLAAETWDADTVLAGKPVTLEFATTDGALYRYEYRLEHGLLCH